MPQDSELIDVSALVPFDSIFQAMIGGYPLGCVVERDGVAFRSIVEDNLGSPDDPVCWERL